MFKKYGRNFIWNTMGSTFNSFNSLFFLIVVTRLNGLYDAGIFSFAFAMATIFFVIGVYSGRVFQVTECDGSISDKDFIVHRIITCVAMLLVSFVFVIANGYGIYKLAIFMLICLFRCIEALSEVFYGIVQKNERLDIAGKSLFIKALLGITIFIVLNIITNNLIIAIVGLCVINIIIFLTYDLPRAFKMIEKNVRVNKEAVVKIFKVGLFTFLFTLLSLYVINAPRYAIDQTLSSDIQGIFGIIFMPSTILLLFATFIIQPVLTRLLDTYEKSDKKGFLKIVCLMVLAIVIITTIVLVIAYYLSIPVLNLIYGIQLESQLNNLLIIMVGASLFTIITILSGALITMRKTGIQLCIFLITAIFAYFASHILVDRNGLEGGVQAYFYTMAIRANNVCFCICYNS
ncbi:MAG: lipopolysaccharide biosynthesis protein [Oscillospiraceae bacterium]|nr:lipopolysaccharide biosynthesis protein [Oscillospiraceae bacterium]